MIIKNNIKKILSSILTATYLLIYAAPMGLCLPVTPKIDAVVTKPVLRSPVKPSSLKLEGDISISKKNPKISLSLRNSDVKQVLRMFADKAGLNIIFHSSVDSAAPTSSSNSQSASNSQSSNNSASGSPSGIPSPSGSSAPNVSPLPNGNSSSGTSTSSSPTASAGRTVTMDLVNVPLNDAFKMVMQVSGLTYYIDHNTMIIADATAAQSLNLAKQELMTIPVKYVDASSLAAFLNKNIFSINKPGLSNSQIAVTNPNSNEILIFGTPNDFIMAKKIVAQFDVKPLEETFVVNHTTPKEMADLLCNVLFKSKSLTNGSGSSSGGSSSGGSSSGLSLGAGVVACQFNNAVNAGALSSLNNSSLSIAYFTDKGTIDIMGGSAQQMEQIKDFILKNDKKQPQAYLEISIVELSEDGSRSFNNTWNVWSNMFSGTFNGTTTTNPLYPNFFTGDGFNVVDKTDPTKILYSLSKFSGTPTIAYTMNYLIKNGKGRVLANPRIMITNGQPSKIDLSSDYIKQVTSQVLAQGGGLAGGVQKTYTIGSDEGIIVDMIPFISPEGYVTLNIQPKYSTIKEKVTEHNLATDTDDLVATLLQRRNLDLKNIRIKDGETLVIGGMIREEEQKNIAKIPVLGDLPGVGMFFRNTSTTKAKQELVIMITPKIIKDSEDIVSKPDATL